MTETSDKNHSINKLKERRRLEALESYGILDSAPEAAFDRITQLAADVFDVPMASISLIDSHRQWFKSTIGLDVEETPRQISFCSHIIDSGEPLIVLDTMQDKHFSVNPLVTGSPWLRFYAGAPLITNNGAILGSLWVGDTKPRSALDDKSIRRLQNFANIVMSELELRRQIKRRKKAQQEAADHRTQVELTLALSGTASFEVDIETGAIVWGGAYMRVWGEDADENCATLDTALDRVHPEDRSRIQEAIEAAQGDETDYNEDFRIVLPSGEVRWIEGRGDFSRRNGRDIFMGLNFDITETVEQREQQTLFTRELHHRMRNLFATLQSIMTLTRKSATSIDDYVERISGRLRALNRAQQILLDTNFVTGSLKAMIRDLQESYQKIQLSGPDITLPENAIVSLSLVLNELATNAAKYGALAADEGYVTLDWKPAQADGDDVIEITWAEYGGAATQGVPERSGFGSTLINHSVQRNLHGEITREWEKSGLVCHIVFPAPESD